MKYRLQRIREDSKAMQRLYAISAATVLIIAALCIRSLSEPDMYILDDDGSAVAIKWEDGQQNKEYHLQLTVETDEGKSQREVTIRRRTNLSDSEGGNTEISEEARRELEISNLISEIEISKKHRIMLPKRLSDGSRLSWNMVNENKSDFLIIPIMYLVLVLMVIRSSLATPKEAIEARRESILRDLPRFSNQLLLMMNAGMILSDSFEHICRSYSQMPEPGRSFFENSMIDICNQNKDHRISTAQMLSDYAAKYNVKEMMRIATILTESERRGSDVVANLERESTFLWESRKVRASEKGKALDAKMAYPLGLLLILLIVITIAPAFLTM